MMMMIIVTHQQVLHKAYSGEAPQKGDVLVYTSEHIRDQLQVAGVGISAADCMNLSGPGCLE